MYHTGALEGNTRLECGVGEIKNDLSRKSLFRKFRPASIVRAPSSAEQWTLVGRGAPLTLYEEVRDFREEE